MMEYRIVKLGTRPIDRNTYDGNVKEFFFDEDFYVVEYRNNKPSIWNLWHPKWHPVTYNMEHYLRHGNGWNPARPRPCNDDGIYDIGIYIPGLETAKAILAEFKKYNETNEKHGGDVKTGNIVVYSELEDKNSAVMGGFDSLLKKKK